VIRTGECACGSAACCKYVQLEVPDAYAEPDTARWLGLHGMKIEMVGAVTTVRIDTPCSALTEDNKCGIYDDRPKMCADYPQSMAGVPSVCTYSFVTLDELLTKKIEVKT